MIEEGSSNSNLDLKKIIFNQSKYIDLQMNYNKIQLELMEEKSKNIILEKKYQSLEDENKILKKEMNEKIQKLNSSHEKEIKNLKQVFQQLIDEKSNKYVNDLFDKKISELTFILEQLNNLNCKQLNFVQIKNKWIEIGHYFYYEYFRCCENNCINTNNPIGNCIEGNGFINLINDENIKYINCVHEKKAENKSAGVYAENQFEKPHNCINYSLFYFEIKCELEGEIEGGNDLTIGLKNYDNNYIRFVVEYSYIRNEKNGGFKLPPSFSWKNNDTFGCGLVYPPTKTKEYPYVFFTQNGKQIGKAVISKDNCSSYRPFIALKHCSVETNFGNDTTPFIYDISKHFVLKEFY